MALPRTPLWSTVLFMLRLSSGAITDSLSADVTCHGPFLTFIPQRPGESMALRRSRILRQMICQAVLLSWLGPSPLAHGYVVPTALSSLTSGAGSKDGESFRLGGLLKGRRLAGASLAGLLVV